MAQGDLWTQRRLGGGWLGAAHLATLGPDERQVVARSIAAPFLRSPEARSRLLALVSSLGTPPRSGIVPLLRCIDQEDGSALLTMPFVKGEDLAELVDRRPGEPLTHGLRIVREVALMLEAGQRAGLRHLALRPSQILVHASPDTNRGVAVHLLGLGLADALGMQRPAGLLSPRVLYLAPEQDAAAPAATLDERTDVYALGVLLLYLLRGRQPCPQEIQLCRSDPGAVLGGRGHPEDTLRLLQSMLEPELKLRPKLLDVVRSLAVERQAALRDETLSPPAVAADEGTGPRDLCAAADSNPGDAVAGAQTPEPALFFGNFRILRRIGQGGMGVVYEAEHRQIGRRAAVKILHPRLARSADYAARFLNEARAVNIVRHPGLVEIFEYGQQPGGALYIVMELLQGESLRARMEQQEELCPISQITEWAGQIARALTATHAKGIIHRDLKPENIMIVRDPLRSEQDWVKILDFGVAKWARSAPSASDLPAAAAASADADGDAGGATAAGAVMGTPLYMAPEQYASAGVVDDKADVFSLGAMLYELLAGSRPYEIDARCLLTNQAAPLEARRADVPRELAVLVHQMLSVRPAERPVMAEAASRLTALASQKEPRSSYSCWRAGGILVLLVGLCGLFGYVGQRLLRPPTLAEAREQALLLVKKTLSSAVPADELQAARALGESRDIEYRPLLEPLLAEKQPALVAAAARGLGEMSAIEAQPALLVLLEETTDPSLRMEIASSLAQLSHPRGIGALRSLLAHGDDLTKMEAALRLLEHGDRSGAALLHELADRESMTEDRAIPVLAALARAGDPQARQRLGVIFERSTQAGKEEPLLAFSLARLGDVSAQRKLTQIAARAGPEQVVAARFLAALGQPDGYPVLLKTGSDRRAPERLRELAFDGLGDSGRAEAAEGLARSLAEAAITIRLRLCAAGAILQLAAGAAGVHASRSLSWARAALGSDSSATRELAVMLLGDLETDETIAPLRLALRDSDLAVRSGAARALGRKRARAALDALTDALDDAEAEVRAAGMQSMGRVASALRERGARDFEAGAISRLQRMREQGTALDRTVAAGTLLRMGDSGQGGVLRDSLSSADPLIRKMAVELMEPDPEVLLDALKDADQLVRYSAARRLAELGRRDGIEVLRSSLGEGGAQGLVAYGLLAKLGESAAPPPDLSALFAGHLLREKETVLDALSLLPPQLALDVMLVAATDAANMIRRRVAEAASEFYALTMQPAFRDLIFRLRNDADIIVRSRVAELVASLPAATREAEASMRARADGEPAAAPVPAPAAPALPPRSDTAAPSPVRRAETAIPAALFPGARRGKASRSSALPATASRLKADPRAETMGLVQVYVAKGGRCQLANQYYLPPGDHIINVDGGQSRTVSVYAGQTIPIRQCP